MTFTQLYSSSKGNLYVVTASSGKRLLIECGVSWRELQEALNYDLNGIEGCLLSHEHKDHSKAFKEVMQAGIDIYSSKETFDALGIKAERRAKSIIPQTLIRFNGIQALSFSTSHDAAAPIGFVVRADNEFLLFATDTSHIRQRFKYQFNIIAIECSYDKEILQERVDTGDINESLAKRLLTSHMEKQNTMAYLTEHTDLSNCHQINLLHLSSDNIEKEQTRVEFEKKLFIETRIK